MYRDLNRDVVINCANASDDKRASDELLAQQGTRIRRLEQLAMKDKDTTARYVNTICRIIETT